MKTRTLLFAIVLLQAAMFLCCEKTIVPIEDQNDYYSDLNDLLLMTMSQVSWEQKSYDLDLDKDSIADVSIKIHSSYHTLTGTTYFIQLKPLNGYEILYSDMTEETWRWDPSLPDTIYSYNEVKIPTFNSIGDLINVSDNFTSDSLMLVYSYSPSTRATTVRESGIYRRLWITNDYGYVGFRKHLQSDKRLAWLKVHVLNPNVIKLHSCKYFANKNMVLIVEE